MTDSEDGRRQRTHTMKGQDLFQSSVDSYITKLHEAWRTVELALANVEPTTKMKVLHKAEDTITASFKTYSSISKDFLEFLSRVRTAQSENIIKTHQPIFHANEIIVEKSLQNIDELKQNALEVASSSSKVSFNKSTISNASYLVATKRAKAEAARVKAEFAEKETQVRKEQAKLMEKEKLSSATIERSKAELKADLELLSQRKNAASAEAEFRAYQQEVAAIDHDGSVFNLETNMEPMNKEERVRQFVEDLDLRNNDISQPRKESVYPTPRVALDFEQCVSDVSKAASPVPLLNVHAPSFHPIPKETDNNQDEQLSEFARFLLKKDLLLSRLINYNDKPETYAVWKASFKNVMKELQASTTEELDLIVKYLGPESSKQANSIRVSNFNDPVRGLERIWNRLDERFGYPEMVESALKQKLACFPRLTVKDYRKLYELADILSEIEAVKENEKYSSLLAYYDSSSGILPIVNKLPHPIQEKWTTHAVNYKKKFNVSFPPFTVFADFIREMSRIKNNPSFLYDNSTSASTIKKSETNRDRNVLVSTKKTELTHESNRESDKECPLHHTKHSLNHCRAFKTKSLSERKKLLKDYNMCFRCCETTTHQRKSCNRDVKCSDCGSSSHATAMHATRPKEEEIAKDGELRPGKKPSLEKVDCKCTEICGDITFKGRSCSKMVLVRVYPREQPEKSLKVYTIIDDQSNRSLARPQLFDFMNIQGHTTSYTLTSCAGTVLTRGRQATGLVVEAIDGSSSLDLPTVIECEQIPDTRSEIPTQNIAKHYSHLRDISHLIPHLEEETPILLLIGRDLLEAHHVFEQRLGPRDTPFAQRLKLGWVIIGESCFNKIHKPDIVNVNKIHYLADRPSLFEPCSNAFETKQQDTLCSTKQILREPLLGSNIFERTKDDEKLGLSMDDRDFLDIMNKEMKKDCEGNWTAPLPFRKHRQKLHNNRQQALKRAHSLTSTLRKDPAKEQHFICFMEKLLRNKHAELAPPIEVNKEHWYLPLFGVYHPQKPGQIRGVFDSSAKYNNVSLNDVLLSGPDLTNSLIGVLLRFRREAVALMADIEHMFYCFRVDKSDRDFLRFLWHKDNNIERELIDYRMCVHVFGNSPSPAVATYGLRKTAQIQEESYGKDVKEFVFRNFYVDDALISLPNTSEAISLLKRTQEALKVGANLRLHKISSNSQEVMNSFPPDDLAKDLCNIDLSKDDLPKLRSLGLTWNLREDCFSFKVAEETKAYTRRGVLSFINSLYDPIGFVAPIVLQGKILLRELTSGKVHDWDEELPIEHQRRWDAWRDSLCQLDRLLIPRMYVPFSLKESKQRQLHVFSDASESGIAAVAYIKVISAQDTTDIGFVLGKGKVAPLQGHTIPRLELCAAVMATEIAELALDHLDVEIDSVNYYTDSRIVLGYIHNNSRRFHTYVSNRVQRIRIHSNPEQWQYVPTHLNPADEGTRGISVEDMNKSMWLNGPKEFLDRNEFMVEAHSLVNPDEDKEVRCMKTLCDSQLGTKRFERFSDWDRLVEAVALIRRSIAFRKGDEGKSFVYTKTLTSFHSTEKFLIKTVQREMYPNEMACLLSSMPLPRNSSILSLNPILDDQGIMRVGGRLSRMKADPICTQPILIPGKHYMAILLIRKYHQLVRHQGRHFTEAKIRSSGFWVTGCKRLVSSFIHKCVICKKQRGMCQTQKMSDLPEDRLVPGQPPFTSVGVDIFGPWEIITRRTRGGPVNSKRWAALFTCLVTRAVHIEVIEEMSASSFINALRRFVAIRGPVKEFRSDRGTNFIGAADLLRIDTIHVEDGPVKDYLYGEGTVWIFNPPHSSHMGGVWERMIGITHRILNSMLSEGCAQRLTHEVLSTFLAEASAIINSRPLTSVSTDPESPFVLTPNILLTQKSNTVEEELANVDKNDLLRSQWKRVQHLARDFWDRWKKEYLHTLQNRRKWLQEERNICVSDIVLLKDKQTKRHDWPLGRIIRIFPSEDNLVRKVEVNITKDGKSVSYTRPVTDLVFLIGDKGDG